MMKRILKLFLLLSAAVIAASCDFDTYENATLAASVVLNPTEYTFPESSGGTVKFEIQASGDWILIAPEGISVTPKYGSGTTTVSVFVPDNRNLGEPSTPPRSFTVSVCGSGIVVPFNIYQPGSGD